LRARIIYLAIPVITVVALMTLGILVSREIANESARRLARQYSIEAAANFQTSVNQHFVLMQQVSRSMTISRWLANSQDSHVRALAFEEIMGYAVFSPETRLMFTSYEGFRGYNFLTSLTADEFVSWGSMVGSGPVMQWFYDTRDADKPFILNIQQEQPQLTGGEFILYIWANHRMYYQNRFVGVVTVGFPFYQVFETVFGGYDAAYMRGYVIDGNGLVRSDSAGLMTLHDGTVAIHLPVPEALSNPNLAAYIAGHLRLMEDGMFLPGIEICDAIPLAAGDYSYASISPIMGTSWSILVLSNYVGGFGGLYTPIILGAVLVMVLSTLTGVFLVRNAVLTPLFKLTQSTTEMDSAEATIFGAERDDEIGELARTIASSRKTLKYREKLLDAVTQAAKILLTASDAEATNAMMASMELIGRCVDVDRVQIWRNENIGGKLYFVMRYQWLSEVGKQKREVPMDFKAAYHTMPSWFKLFSEGGNMNSPVSKLNPEDVGGLKDFDVASIVNLPLFFGENFVGILSINDCRNERVFTADEMSAFASMGSMFASEFHRMEQEAEIKAAEIAEEANRAKTRFLARMSHELRTPITSVVGVSEINLRRRKTLSPNIQDAFEKINNSGNLLLGIVNDILDFSKIESGKMPLVNAEYEVASLITDATQLHAVYLEHKNILFDMKIDENLPAYLIGDVLRIRQVMNNLISNAFKYTENGRVMLELSYEDSAKDDYINLKISIRDTGIGMTAEQLESLKTSEYARFHEKEGFVHGTGLGISIVYSLAQLMGAQVDFDSEVGMGTFVNVSIPQKICSLETLGSELAESLQNFESGTWVTAKELKFVPESMPYGKVLVVDDVDANLFVAQGLLAFYDLHIDTCTSGMDAINMIKQGDTYDIIFMDHMMPVLNGTDTMRKLREIGYDRPIVALTANALVGHAEDFMKKGFDDFVSKPINTMRLDEVLRKFVWDEARAGEAGGVEPGIEDFMNTPEVLSKLRSDFARDHKNTFEKIMKAIAAGDTSAAYHLSHTVKGLAGLISEDALMQASQDMENSLRKDITPTTAQISAMEAEMERALKSIAANAEKAPSLPATVGKEKALAVLDKLIPLLETRNAESTDLIEDLRAIPEALILVSQVDTFEFEAALKSAKVLRDFW